MSHKNVSSRRLMAAMVAVGCLWAASVSSATAQETEMSCAGLPVTHVVKELPKDAVATEGDDVVFIDVDGTAVNGASSHVWTLGGDDTICLSPAALNLVVHAGEGDDHFPRQTVARVAIYMGPGNDRGYFDASMSSVSGGPGNDRIEGSRALFDGGAGDDTLISWPDPEGAHLSGGAGNDVIVGAEGPDIASGGGGDDVLRGFGGNDRLAGGPGNDVLVGGPGEDTLRGDQGADLLFGGAGDDLLGATVTNRHPGDQATVPDTAGSRIYGGTGNDALLGSTRWDRLIGGPGNDVLAGFEGQDQLRGGAGNDRLFGGANVDVLLGNTGADRLYLQGADTGAGGFGIDSCVGVEADAVQCENAAGPSPVTIRVGQAQSIIWLE